MIVIPSCSDKVPYSPLLLDWAYRHTLQYFVSELYNYPLLGILDGYIPLGKGKLNFSIATIKLLLKRSFLIWKTCLEISERAFDNSLRSDNPICDYFSHQTNLDLRRSLVNERRTA